MHKSVYNLNVMLWCLMRETSEMPLRTLFFSQYTIYDVAYKYIYRWCARQCTENLFSCSTVMIFISFAFFLSFPADARNILLNNVTLSQAVQYFLVLAGERRQYCHYAFIASQEILPILYEFHFHKESQHETCAPANLHLSSNQGSSGME